MFGRHPFAQRSLQEGVLSKKGKHQTVETSLKPNMKWLENLEIVERVIIGLSEACRHKFTPGHIKVQGEVDGGLRLNTYSGRGVTKVFVGVAPENKEALRKLIEERMK